MSHLDMTANYLF